MFCVGKMWTGKLKENTAKGLMFIIFNNKPIYIVQNYNTKAPTCLDEVQVDSPINNKLIYWIKYATKTTCFGPLLWGHLQV